MFDWLGDILSGMGDALSVVFEGLGADIAVDIWNALVEWIYTTIFDAVADLFTSMNNMGAEIFTLGWVNAVVRLFTLFGWALFAVGVAGAVFEVAIEAQTGKTSIQGAAINILKAGWKKNSYAAACGVSDKVLWQCLKDYSQLKKVLICLDNDNPGKIATEKISQKLEQKNIDHAILVPRYKDWNEDLLHL